MYQFNDGGRAAAGFKGQGSDCAVRALSIATGMNYKAARKLIKEFAAKGKQGNKAIGRGVYKEDFDTCLRSLGWKWVSAPKFEGRKARYSDIKGTAILRMAQHFATVIDGVLYDSFDSRDKMVYGYWVKTN